MADQIPIDPFDEEESPGQALRPATIEDAMRPLSAILGEDVVVFIRDDVNANDVAMPLTPVPAASLVAMIPALLGGSRPGQTLVSDGHMSHAITVLEARDGRLVFFDPWNTESFLQDGRNLAGIKALSEGAGTYSVTPDELDRVIIAQGIAGLGKIAGLVVPPAWDAFQTTEFFSFFHLSPDGDPVKHGDGLALPYKTGGFRQYLDLGFEIDAAKRLRAGVIEINQAWLLGPNRMLGMDVLKSFVEAMVPRDMTLTPLGISSPALVPAPDLHMTDALHKALAAAMHGRQPPASSRLDRLVPIFAVIAGQSEEAHLSLLFTHIRAVSRGGTLLLRIEQRG
jgi:hypothetical protein